jgi:glycosyltransferase involved in cell wall biosynthesis
VISIILPSRCRPEKLRDALQSIKDTSPDSEIVVVTGDAATVAREFGCVLVECENDLDAISKYNMGARVATGSHMMPACDNMRWLPGWEKAVEGLEFATICDPARDVNIVVSRRFLKEHNGGVLYCPHYKSWYPDLEMIDRGDRVGIRTRVPGIWMNHLHQSWGTAPADSTHEIGAKYRGEDFALYNQRAAAGFPNDFEPHL